MGAGIYVLLGSATEVAGTGVWLSFLIAGGCSALTALSYAELASMFPAAGAEYEYTRRVAAPSVAFLVGWIMIAGLVVAASTVALGFATYLEGFTHVPVRLGALGLLGVLLAVSLAGIGRSTRVTVLLSLIQVGGLVAIIVMGLSHLGAHSLVSGISLGGPVIKGAALVFFAFIGFDEVITLSEETASPTRTVPRALLLTLGISTALYVGVAIAGLSVLGTSGLARSTQPLTDVARAAVGPGAGSVVTAVALIATINTTLLCLTAASRLSYGMVSTGALPPSIAELNARKAPWRALVLSVILAAGLAMLGNITFAASVTDVAVFLVFVAVNATVVVLRIRQPHRLRPFRVPWSVGRVPLPTVAALGTVGFLLPSLEVPSLLAAAGLCALGGVVYAVLALRAARRDTISSEAEGEMRRTHITIKEVEQAAARLRIDFSAVAFSADELRRGMEVELQHGRVDPDTNVTDDSLELTAKIALVHLQEIPDYYTRLARMEHEARAYWRSRGAH